MEGEWRRGMERRWGTAQGKGGEGRFGGRGRMEVAGKGLQGGGKGGGGQRGEGGRVDREVVVVMVAGAGAERGCGRKTSRKGR